MKTEKHPSFPKFELKAHVDVDAGSIWIGDGCYVLKDSDEKRPEDLGKDWGGICSRYFERSGYDAMQREYRNWYEGYRETWWESEELKTLEAERPPRPEDFKHDRARPEAEKCDYERWMNRNADVQNAFAQKWREGNPFQPTNVNTGIASFKHDMGHEGMGVMVSTFYGDGTYPVYVEYGEGGRPRRVLIDFDPGGDEEEDEDDEDMDVVALEGAGA